MGVGVCVCVLGGGKRLKACAHACLCVYFHFVKGIVAAEAIHVVKGAVDVEGLVFTVAATVS